MKAKKVNNHVIDGHGVLEKIEIKKELLVNGSVELFDVKAKKIVVNGSIDCTRCKIDDVKVFGASKMKDSKIKSLHSTGYCLLDNAKVNTLTVSSDTNKGKIQLELKNNSMIDKLILDNESVKIKIEEGSKAKKVIIKNKAKKSKNKFVYSAAELANAR